MASLADVSRMIMRTARSAPKLSPLHEKVLINRVQECEDGVALDRLAASNLRAVLAVANRMRGYGLPLDDLVQEGCCGMVLAAQRFDIQRDTPFAAYAQVWIKASMQEFVLRNWSIVRLAMGSDEQRLFFKLRALRAKLMQNPEARSADVTREIASALGVSTADVEVMQARLSQGDFALDAPAFDSDEGDAPNWIDYLAADSVSPDDMLDDDECAADLRAAMAQLDDRERMVMEQRWLVDDIAPLEALAEWFDVSAGTIRKIEVAAFEKVRAAMFAGISTSAR